MSEPQDDGFRGITAIMSVVVAAVIVVIALGIFVRLRAAGWLP